MLQCSSLDPGGGSKTSKRLRSTSPNDTQIDNSQTASKMIRKISFLIIKRTDGQSMTKVSPFLIDKLLTSVAGPVKKAKKLRDGTLLVETFNYDQANKIIDLLPKNISLPVTVEPHRTLNVVKGVINCYDLDSVDIEEVKSNLKWQGIEDVVRMKRRINGELTWSHNYMLHFCQTNLPTDIKIGYLNIPVRAYIPLPRRCYNCYCYNHTKNSCPIENAKCPDCGMKRHENETQCNNEKSCLNCKGKHSALDKNCPQWLIEKEITKIITLEKIPYSEAKKKADKLKPQYSYSDATGKTAKLMHEMESQCNLIHLPPLSKLSPVEEKPKISLKNNKTKNQHKQTEHKTENIKSSELDNETKKIVQKQGSPQRKPQTKSRTAGNPSNQENKYDHQLDIDIRDWDSELEMEEDCYKSPIQSPKNKNKARKKIN